MDSTSPMAVRAALAAAVNARVNLRTPIREAVAPAADAPQAAPAARADARRTLLLGARSATPAAAQDRAQGWSYEFDRSQGG